MKVDEILRNLQYAMISVRKARNFVLSAAEDADTIGTYGPSLVALADQLDNIYHKIDRRGDQQRAAWERRGIIL